jgi:hypothetical protein
LLFQELNPNAERSDPQLYLEFPGPDAID